MARGFSDEEYKREFKTNFVPTDESIRDVYLRNIDVEPGRDKDTNEINFGVIRLDFLEELARGERQLEANWGNMVWFKIVPTNSRTCTGFIKMQDSRHHIAIRDFFNGRLYGEKNIIASIQERLWDPTFARFFDGEQRRELANQQWQPQQQSTLTSVVTEVERRPSLKIAEKQEVSWKVKLEELLEKTGCLDIKDIAANISDGRRTTSTQTNEADWGDVIESKNQTINEIMVSKCVICWQYLYNTKQINIRQCGHLTCHECFRTQAETSNNCCMCRATNDSVSLPPRVRTTEVEYSSYKRSQEELMEVLIETFTQRKGERSRNKQRKNVATGTEGIEIYYYPVQAFLLTARCIHCETRLSDTENPIALTQCLNLLCRPCVVIYLKGVRTSFGWRSCKGCQKNTRQCRITDIFVNKDD